jgi:predicted anti-sigma-YlaC factor YlaD
MSLKLRIRCRESAELMSRLQDQPLSSADALRLRLHLAVCHSCRSVSEQFEAMRQAMARLREGRGSHEPGP